MVRYKMLARDINSAPLQYRTWVVPNTPDLTGALYTGPKSGNNALEHITAYEVVDGYAIVDFNLPLPMQWQSIPDTPFDFPGMQVLPDQVSDSQLAIIDGYAYLFGSKVSDKIYMASINNPATWVDTGATLPTELYGSSLAIVDGYIYLFGGNDGYGSVNTIFSASVSDPLNWTNTGSTLPGNLESSTLGMAAGTLYLFGGLDGDAATNVIYTASTPTTWSVAVGTLPVALYGSSILQANNSWYLLGGQLTPITTTSTIYTATVASPLSWSSFSHLPYPTSFGQVFTMGNDGYYVGPSPGDAGTGFSTIVQCHLSNPAIWADFKQVIPAVLSHSQLAIMVDRFWFLGGSGLSAIFACEQMLKYDFINAVVIAYGDITRTVLQATDNANNPFLALGIPYWKTDLI
jgi:N-acetylneuraminic acid mutarotase